MCQSPPSGGYLKNRQPPLWLGGGACYVDSVFLKDENTRAYLAFKKFYDYRRA